ncbi:MAG: MBL fold metallo-hydrolase [Firmicutes bacterium]|nr:MBL fold metallo-hydrolase [Bacillota bacterium]
MLIKGMEVGSFAANCYMLACEETREGVLIDPGAEAAQILAMVKEANVNITYIINTHGHFDHTGANEDVRKALGVPLLIHEADGELYSNPTESLTIFSRHETLAQADRFLQDGQQLHVGKLTVTVIATPGHTKGSICLQVEDSLFSGDTLFAGSIGRTDLPGGSFDEIIPSIMEKLLTLPSHTVVYPGHGPQTTIGEEIEHNPFLR